MFQVFLVCAVIGGTIFIVQFVLALVGFGGEDFELGDDIPDDMPEDFPEEFGDAGDVDAVTDGQGDVHDHGSTWLFGVISLRTVVAATTFFGLAGIASLQAGQTSLMSLAIALVAGAGAMYGVHYLMRLLYGLRHDGTERIGTAVGKRATVYVPIPGNRTGRGKVQMRLQGRVVEYLAVTSAPEKLPTGSMVEVANVLSSSTLEVNPVSEPAAVAKTGQ